MINTILRSLERSVIWALAILTNMLYSRYIKNKPRKYYPLFSCDTCHKEITKGKRCYMWLDGTFCLNCIPDDKKEHTDIFQGREA